VIHEKPRDRVNERKIGEALARAFGATWEGTGTLDDVDGYLHREGCLAVVECKWREYHCPTLFAETAKLERLIERANTYKVLPIYAWRTPKSIYIRLLTISEFVWFEQGEMTLNEPRDSGDYSDPGIYYPIEHLQRIK
jgi:hypothetical protein